MSFLKSLFGLAESINEANHAADELNEARNELEKEDVEEVIYVEHDWENDDRVKKIYTFQCRVNLLDGSIEYETKEMGYTLEQAQNSLAWECQHSLGRLENKHGTLFLKNRDHEYNSIAFPQHFIKNIEFKSKPIKVEKYAD